MALVTVSQRDYLSTVGEHAQNLTLCTRMTRNIDGIVKEKKERENEAWPNHTEDASVTGVSRVASLSLSLT